MNELALFSGAGGGILGGHLLGWRTVAAVEIEDYPRRVLLQRQADGILPRFPIWDDVCTFDGKPWRGKVDVISGGFPCQDISQASTVHSTPKGLDGARSGLWTEMGRICGEVEPRFIFVENSPMLTVRGLGTVLGDLAEMGYNARWGVLGAVNAGGKHNRQRIWIVAHPNGNRLERRNKQGPSHKRQRINFAALDCTKIQSSVLSAPRMVRRVNDLANIVDRLKAIGNGQVPAVAALAWQILSEGLEA